MLRQNLQNWDKNNGEIINNEDVVMIYYQHLPVYYHDTSLNYCPGKVPPAYLT